MWMWLRLVLDGRLMPAGFWKFQTGCHECQLLLSGKKYDGALLTTDTGIGGEEVA